MKSKVNKLIVMAGLLLCFSFVYSHKAAWAGWVVLNGSVLDSQTRQPLSGAVVTVKGQQVVSNGGYYYLPLYLINNEPLQLTCYKEGYAAYRKEVYPRSDVNTVDIYLDPLKVNRPPVLSAIGNKSISEGQALSFTVSATDPDADSLTYSSSNLPQGASFNPSTRAFSWTPNFTQAGTYPNLKFTVSDGPESVSEAISINVNNVNRAPTLSSIGNKTVSEGQLLSFTISAQDQDSDDILTYSASNLTQGASFNPSTRAFSWTPSPGQGGKDYPVTFKVEDGKGGQDQETITITVPSPQPNRPPTLNPIGAKSIKEGQALEFTVTATDLDNDPLTFSATPLPQGASFDPQAGKFKWTPGYDQAKDYKLRFSVSDGK